MEYHLAQPLLNSGYGVWGGVHLAFNSAGVEPVACHFPALVDGGVNLVLEGRFFIRLPSGTYIPLPEGFVSTARAEPLTLYRTPRLRCVGLRLLPAATLGLLQSSPLLLPNQMVDATDVFGPQWADLVDTIKSAIKPSNAVDLLVAFVRERLCQDVHVRRVQRATLLQRVALREMTSQNGIGLSTRQFERVFAETFGLRPKVFQRVSRIEGLLRDAMRIREPGTELALRHGYYDQSHMARELVTLAGAPLRTLVAAARQPNSEYWALDIGVRLSDLRT